MNVSFIRKGGRIIPIKSAVTNTKKDKLWDQINDLMDTHEKVKSPFIKKNASDRIRELVEKVKMLKEEATA